MIEVSTPTVDNGIPNFRMLTTGLFRGGQPTAEGFNWLKNVAHVARIIKLNLEIEASDQVAKDLGIEVVYLPIDLCEQLIFRPKYADVQAAVKAMQPRAFIHCTNGWDRTGLVVGCYRVLVDGWSKHYAYAEMLLHGFHSNLLGLTLFWEWAI